MKEGDRAAKIKSFILFRVSLFNTDPPERTDLISSQTKIGIACCVIIIIMPSISILMVDLRIIERNIQVL